MITHILFDNNGVLTTSDSETTDRNVAEFLGMSIVKVRNLVEKFIPDLDRGKISQKEFYEMVLKEGNLSFDKDEFEKVHLGSYVPKPNVQDFAKELKKDYDLYMLSNFGDAFWDMFEKWGLDKIFLRENVFVSSDIGMIKPEEEVFRFVLRSIGVKAKEIVFIDDNVENIDSAKRAEINVVHFTSLEGLKKSLKRLGVGL